MDRTRAALLAIGLLVAVLGPVGVAAAATGNADVEDYGFAPAEVRIEPGDRVRWTNQGSEVHTVTSDDPATEDFDSGRLGSGEEYTHSFSEAGTFPYHCEIYPSMSGVVQVGPPPTTTSSTTTSTTSSTTTTTEPAPTTTTTTRPAPTPTTIPPSPTTTVTTSRTPAGAESPAPPTSTAPTTTTRPAVTTTTTPVESTTTTVVETTTTTATAATEPATPLGPAVPEAPPPVEDGEGDLAGQQSSARPSGRSDGGANASVVLLVAVLLGSGAFGGWTLWKLRPGNA